MEFAVLSDQGLVRSKNEDNFLADEVRGLFIVCDGMGGHKSGEVASSMAVECINKFLPSSNVEINLHTLNEAVCEANKKIFDNSMRNLEFHGMGTTVTAAVVKGHDLFISHVGDSGLFVISDGRIKKVTNDHTLAEQMVRDSILSPRDIESSPYNHVLTRALGVEEQVKIDNYEEHLKEGDMFLLCSDGLTDLLSQQDILDLAKQEQSLQKIVQSLVFLALERGGSDNITVILASI
ncbi:MAG: Stp1/IreP family PP2C-type Ser/Thr phosphatase [Syntrophomonadaceae bacterium]|jgi:protein phosphatase|nr:Stp1/IreP family PP2C-type Ser/Thr phosphatase [Syntrophomonadaceae bacterium]